MSKYAPRHNRFKEIVTAASRHGHSLYALDDIGQVWHWQRDSKWVRLEDPVPEAVPEVEEATDLVARSAHLQSS